MRNLIIKDGGRHAVDQMTCCKNDISPESKRNVLVKKKGTGSFNQVSIEVCENKMFDGGYPVN